LQEEIFMKLWSAIALLALAACGSQPKPLTQTQDWQFVETADTCEIQSTVPSNPLIIWRASSDTRARLQARMLINTRTSAIADGDVITVYLDQLKFELPVFDTLVPGQMLLDYQSLGIIAPFFVSAFARSNTMRLETKHAKYTYTNRGFGTLADLWTDCYIFHGR
jgi:hypothetical protein